MHTISDYPLVEAIHQNIVKHPVLPDEESRNQLQERPTVKHVEKYKDYIDLGVTEWHKAYLEHKKLDKKAILFVMSDGIANCEEIAEYLESTHMDLKGRVLSIHTDKDGNFNNSKAGSIKLEEARELAHDIDSNKNKYRVIVSVMMLREGWDVKNVTTIVGLRPFSSKSNILPEQTIGRGLRRMYPEAQQERVTVIGTRAFMLFVEQVRNEGVQLLLEPMLIGNSQSNSPSIIVEIDHDNKEKDLDALNIEIPILTKRLYKHYETLSELDIDKIEFTPLDYVDLPYEGERKDIKFVYALTGEESHITTLYSSRSSDYRQVIGFFTEAIMRKARLFRGIDDIFPKVEAFVKTKLFARAIDLDSIRTLLNLSEKNVIDLIIESFVNSILKLITQENPEPLAIKKTINLVRDVKPYRSDKIEAFLPQKNPFNKIVVDSGLEREFAELLEKCADVVSYTKNYFSIHFSIDYVGISGQIGSYHPDFIIKLKDERVFIAETKGLEDLDTAPKFTRLLQWCEDANKAIGRESFFCLYVMQPDLDNLRRASFLDVINLCEHKRPQGDPKSSSPASHPLLGIETADKDRSELVNKNK